MEESFETNINSKQIKLRNAIILFLITHFKTKLLCCWLKIEISSSSNNKVLFPPICSRQNSFKDCGRLIQNQNIIIFNELIALGLTIVATLRIRFTALKAPISGWFIAVTRAIFVLINYFYENSLCCYRCFSLFSTEIVALNIWEPILLAVKNI
jgi:hypothetical protein